MNNLLQSLFGLAVSAGVILVLFVFAWYVALPLLLIGLLIFAARVIYVRYLMYKTARQFTDAFTQRPRAPKRKKEPTENIIDVEYTELN